MNLGDSRQQDRIPFRNFIKSGARGERHNGFTGGPRVSAQTGQSSAIQCKVNGYCSDVSFFSPCLSEVCGLVHEGLAAARRRWGWFGPRSRSGLGFGEA